MGKAASKAENSGGAVLDDPRLLVTEIEGRLATLNASLAAARQRQSELNQERAGLVRAARLEGKADAQKRLRVIDDELTNLSRDVSDDSTVVEALTEELAAAERARITAEWEEQRNKIRALLISRAEGQTAANVIGAARALVEALKKAAAEDREVYEALCAFDERRAREWTSVARATDELARLAAVELWKVLPIDGREVSVAMINSGRDAVKQDRRFYSETLSYLDRLELVL